MKHDKLAIWDELHLDVLAYYHDKDRRQQHLEAVHEGKAVVNGKLVRLRQFMANSSIERPSE
jgi:hypothetical protein